MSLAQHHEQPVSRTIDDEETDICQNIDGMRMHVETPGRITFDEYFAWENLGGPCKCHVIPDYQAGLDMPGDLSAYPHIASLAERQDAPLAIRVFEVGLIIADDPEKYTVKKGSAIGKDPDQEYIQRDVLDREPQMLRVVVTEPQTSPKKPQLWALCRKQGGHFCRRLVKPNAVFFYSEFMVRNPIGLPRYNRQVTALHYIKRYVTQKLVAEQLDHEQEDIIASNPHEASSMESDMNEIRSAISLATDKPLELDGIKKLGKIFGNLSHSVYIKPTTNNEAVMAFFNWGTPFTLEDAVALTNVLQSPALPAPQLYPSIIMFAREVLDGPSPRLIDAGAISGNVIADQPRLGWDLAVLGLPFFIEEWNRRITSPYMPKEDAVDEAIAAISAAESHCRLRLSLAESAYAADMHSTRSTNK